MNRVFRPRSFTGVRGPLLVLAFQLLAACNGAGGDGPGGSEQDAGNESAASAAAPGDTARLRSLYDSIDARFEQLAEGYRSLGSQVPTDTRTLVGAMERMHVRVDRMHAAMMEGMQGGGPGRGRMGGGMRGGMGGMMGREGSVAPGPTGEWDWQMETMHRQMAGWMRAQGHEEMARLHDDLADLHGRARSAVGAEEGGEATAPDAPVGTVTGASVFEASCASCHGARGTGLAGVFPPLADSRWVAAEDPTVPVRIVLGGLSGPVDVAGRSYDGTMPAFAARLSDAEIAAVVSYLRTELNGGASGVGAAEVDAVREAMRGRTGPWRAAELR